MKGWSFRTVKLSANGSTTIQTLNDEKKRLDNRLIQIPVLIANLEKSTATIESDKNWLSALNDRRRKNWEEENKIKVVDAIARAERHIIENNATCSAIPVVDSNGATQSKTYCAFTDLGVVASLDTADLAITALSFTATTSADQFSA